jgi:hypothetical protein
MVILGIIGGALSKMMMGQQRFFQRTAEQMNVRRELRTGLSVLPTELRGLSSVAGDLVTWTASSVTFRSTLGSSIICAKSNSTTFDIPPLNGSKAITTSWYANPDVGDTLFVLSADSSGSKGDFWSAHRITSISPSSSYCVGSVYTDANLDAGKSRYRLLVSPALPDSAVVGSPIRFTRSARYALSQQASGRYYLTRTEYLNGGWGAAIPVSGPYMAPGLSGSGGMYVAMYDSTGAAVASTANATKVARIDLTLRAQGLSSSGTYGSSTTTVIDSVQLRIAMRNRR